ncbi:MAG: class I SAM-dependent methyltransferase [Dehalococcoidia bacterium]|uniref:class I SAM-dependent methyltransferase n=1 Tax=Candidatus Amarobacter glycogenicus TaxID=3140699 RepID=UPI001D4BBC05|nr:class I SAM-dependent methyltransferase [Dehalococcoidia bacterium]MBK7725150.1 class I SAM-dependent methyltransferase [Dehalococcoidia bacterium]MBK9545483.1 class I SAM-dependent methyltransferase [Dehalococcoidia bacterium]MBK9611962.1 class I SAM-dependent methyltransferase [Dehalococcoidia bacterium]
MSSRPRMYHELAEWFHLITAPEDYAEEAAYYLTLMRNIIGRSPASLLELGSGGGNNASHYKAHIPDVVLSDRSEEMLALSRTINSELEHIQGDMRTLRLARRFEAVFVHDACSYLTTEQDIRQLAATAFEHCLPGGVAVFCPDHTAENLVYETDHGGHDGVGRALRYLEWTSPGPPDTYEFAVDYAYVLHEDGHEPRVVLDRHVNGAVPRHTWLSALTDAGFHPAAVPLVHSEVPEGYSEVFTGWRPV